MVKYQIEVSREGCIACSTCYGLDPAHYEPTEDNRSKVVGGTVNGKSVGVFDDDKMADAQAAADSCPVSVITLTKL
jgi:ferredoxin